MDFSRQSQIIQGGIAEQTRMLIIGAGGIGSNAAYVAACLGIGNITVFDYDIVQSENIAPQFYRLDQVGQPKVEALAENIKLFTGEVIETHNEMYARQLPKEYFDIVLVAVDSMSARNGIWNNTKVRWSWWLDARMGGTTCSVIAVPADSPMKIRRYEQEFLTWRSNPLPCGRKSTAFITKGTIPGLIGELVANIINGQLDLIPLFQMRDAIILEGSKIE